MSLAGRAPQNENTQMNPDSSAKNENGDMQMKYFHLQLDSFAQESHFPANENEFRYDCFHLHLQMISMPMKMNPAPELECANESRFIGRN